MGIVSFAPEKKSQNQKKWRDSRDPSSCGMESDLFCRKMVKPLLMILNSYLQINLNDFHIFNLQQSQSRILLSVHRFQPYLPNCTPLPPVTCFLSNTSCQQPCLLIISSPEDTSPVWNSEYKQKKALWLFPFLRPMLQNQLAAPEEGSPQTHFVFLCLFFLTS